MDLKKSALIERISDYPNLAADLKVAWSRVLEQTTFTHRDETDLDALREAIWNNKTRVVNGIERWDWDIVSMAHAVDGLIEIRAKARPFWA